MTFPDALGQAGMALAWVGLALYVTGLVKGSRELEHISDGLYAVSSWIMFAAMVLDGDVVWAVVTGSAAVYFTRRWWKNRPRGRRRKALRELGAKSRARIQALADQMTPSPIPSPAGAPS